MPQSPLFGFSKRWAQMDFSNDLETMSDELEAKDRELESFISTFECSTVPPVIPPFLKFLTVGAAPALSTSDVYFEYTFTTPNQLTLFIDQDSNGLGTNTALYILYKNGVSFNSISTDGILILYPMYNTFETGDVLRIERYYFSGGAHSTFAELHFTGITNQSGSWTLI